MGLLWSLPTLMMALVLSSPLPWNLNVDHVFNFILPPSLFNFKLKRMLERKKEMVDTFQL